MWGLWPTRLLRIVRVGLRPFCVMSSAGTTNTGAVDPLNAIADLCVREGIWHHVDGAYGAFFYMCPEFRDLMPRAFAGRFPHARSAQGPVLAIRHRRPARARRRCATPGARGDRELPARSARGRRLLRPASVRAGALAWVPGPSCLALRKAVRRRAVPGRPGREAFPRPGGGRGRGNSPRDRDGGPAAGVALCVPPSLARLQPGKGEHRYPAPGWSV